MIEILEESQGNVLAVKGSGKLTQKDYEDLLIPRLQAIINEYPKARFLFYMDKDFQGWDMNAAWNYAKFGLKHRNRFEKVAAVCGPKWVRLGMGLKSRFIPGSVKTFSCDQQREASDWIKS